MNECLLELGLPQRDFHVTIAFVEEDVHDIPKDEGSLVDVDTAVEIFQSLVSPSFSSCLQQCWK